MARALGLLAVTSVYAFTHDESAACYASRYPKLRARFCATGRCDTHALHDHYKNVGATEKRHWGCGSRFDAVSDLHVAPAMDAAKYDVAAGQTQSNGSRGSQRHTGNRAESYLQASEPEATYKPVGNVLPSGRSVFLGSRFCPAARTSVEQCARQGTVVVTTISKRYTSPMQRLVASANRRGGFPCVVVYAQDDVPELCDPNILPFYIEPPLLPDPFWCHVPKVTQWWGWARSQLYKTYALASLLQKGFDVLLLDADHQTIADPMPTLREARAQGLDIVAQFADPGADRKIGRGYLNFGVSWTRASPRTAAVAQRLHNRSFRGWDQYLWNVEIGAADLACCQCKRLPIGPNQQPDKKQTGESALARGELLCEEPSGPSLGPPQISVRHKLGPNSWNPLGYNTLGWHGGRFATTCTTSCQFTTSRN